MKTTSIALVAVLLMCFGSVALADEAQGPVIMTDAQMDQVVAGLPLDHPDPPFKGGIGHIVRDIMPDHVLDRIFGD